MEIPGTKLTLELMEYYEPVTTDAKHREDVNKINGVRHVALEIQNIDEAFKYIKTCPDITLINPSEQYGPYKIDDITADEVQFLKLIWKQTVILKSSSVRRLAIHIISISLTNMVYSGNLNRDMIIKI